MTATRTSIHGYWSSRFMFVLAAAGSAVGLGNVWKFPYMAGDSGGGAFVLLYLVCIALLGLPVMMSECAFGDEGAEAARSIPCVCSPEEENRSASWSLLGVMGMLAGFLILSYYSVIAGWTLAYVVEAAGGSFSGISADGVGELFDHLVSDPWRLIFWHTLFIVLTMVVILRGVRRGLEIAVRFLMPGLFVLILVMVVYAPHRRGFSGWTQISVCP